MRSKILKILIAVMMVGIITPAFSAVENVKVGGDIAIWGVLRGEFVSGERTHFFQTAARVYVSADLSDNVSAMVRVLNERRWASQEENFNIDLDLAYIKVSDLLTPGLSLTVGRQEIQLGEGLVVGSRYQAYDYPVNLAATDLGVRKAFDAVRLDYAASGFPLNITAFMSKIYEAYSQKKDTDLYGVDVGLKLADMANVDVYYVKRMVRADDDTLDTVGVRVVSGLPAVEGLSLKAEFAKQFGDYADIVDYTGWALLAGFEYKLPVGMEPKVKLNYARYSGDDADTDDEYEGWQLVFPANIGSRIGPILYAKKIQEENLQTLNLGFSFKPMEKVAVSIDGYWNRYLQVQSGSKNLGIEVDLGIDWAITEDLTLGISGGKIFDADALGTIEPWQIIATMKVAF
ncbi:MAG: alginate export family protein, partial [bacterium]|nr:alginate export family protein [bacterium]MDW8164225.1 alginate export family protein [Candidatus Omnitrophota bacterium]